MSDINKNIAQLADDYGKGILDLGSGGGGGSSAFIINVYADFETGGYSADKTFSDISTAISNGQVPVVYFVDDSNDIVGYANLGRVTSDEYEFFLFSMNGTNKVLCHNIKIDALDSVTVEAGIPLN